MKKAELNKNNENATFQILAPSGNSLAPKSLNGIPYQTTLCVSVLFLYGKLIFSVATKGTARDKYNLITQLSVLFALKNLNDRFIRQEQIFVVR